MMNVTDDIVGSTGDIIRKYHMPYGVRPKPPKGAEYEGYCWKEYMIDIEDMMMIEWM